MECFLPNYELITQTSRDHAYVALYLEIVRQFWSPCITRIHGDCHKTVWVKVQFCSFKHKLVLVSSYTTLDAQNLEEKKNFWDYILKKTTTKENFETTVCGEVERFHVNVKK